MRVNFRNLFYNFAQSLELKITQNDSKSPTLTQDESKLVFKMAQNESRLVLKYSKWPKMIQNDPKMAQMDKRAKK